MPNIVVVVVVVVVAVVDELLFYKMFVIVQLKKTKGMPFELPFELLAVRYNHGTFFATVPLVVC
jgi:hypothetical protein